jgi:hypothetical protein
MRLAGCPRSCIDIAGLFVLAALLPICAEFPISILMQAKALIALLIAGAAKVLADEAAGNCCVSL